MNPMIYVSSLNFILKIPPFYFIVLSILRWNVIKSLYFCNLFWNMLNYIDSIH